MTELEQQLLSAFEQQQQLLEQFQHNFGQELRELQQQLIVLAESGGPRTRKQPAPAGNPCLSCKNALRTRLRGQKTELVRCMLSGSTTEVETCNQWVQE